MKSNYFHNFIEGIEQMYMKELSEILRTIKVIIFVRIEWKNMGMIKVIIRLNNHINFKSEDCIQQKVKMQILCVITKI